MWKLQTIVKMKPRVRTRESLPNPPKGMEWEQNETTLEWKLVHMRINSATSERPPLAPSSEENPRIVVDRLPTKPSLQNEEKMDEDDWDLLSSVGGSAGTAVVVTHNGSVRSINSLDDSSTHLSLPFKISRTLSNSTLDSTDADKTLGLLGIDYVEHVVLPNDTLQGICLAYKISATRLRQVNHFSGNSLTLAPKRLVVPFSKKALRAGLVKFQDSESREYKVHAFLSHFSSMKESDAHGYLELADWNLEEAVLSAKEDGDWDRDIETEKANDILITVRLQDGRTPVPDSSELKPQPKASSVKAVTYEGLPAIATKNVRPQDVYNAASQHQGFGVELKSFDSVEETMRNV